MARINRRPPASSIEEREDQLIALAVDLAEKQLREGTASAQVITHYLKLGSTREKMEKEIMREQKKLLEAKTDAIQSSQRIEELYNNAITAMQSYRSPVVTDQEEDADD